MFEKLKDAGFDLVVRNHAQAILEVDFRQQAEELVEALLESEMPIEDLIGSGGGETLFTQRLRRRLYQAEWNKHNFTFKTLIDGVERDSITHEIDHVRRSGSGVIALEIEWNNKDPFFDRDLENFRHLHAQSAISVGVIITRGASMQSEMVDLVEACLVKHGVDDEEGLTAFNIKARTARQREIVTRMMKAGADYRGAFAKSFVSDKFGMATTHWSKLEERIRRGVGNPCPLLLIGLPSAIIQR